MSSAARWGSGWSGKHSELSLRGGGGIRGPVERHGAGNKHRAAPDHTTTPDPATWPVETIPPLVLTFKVRA